MTGSNDYGITVVSDERELRVNGLGVKGLILCGRYGHCDKEVPLRLKVPRISGQTI